MPLSVWQRKESLPFGAQKQIAQEENVDPSFVSRVISDKALDYDPKKVRRVQVRIARKIGMPVAEVFGEGSSLQKVG